MTKDHRRIHIVHVQESLEVGGLENGVVNISNGLDQERFRTTICCLNRLGPLSLRLDNPQVRFLCLDERDGKRPGLFFRLQRLFSDIRPDIVHTHNYYSGFYGIVGARLSRRPRIVHGEHGNPLVASMVQRAVVRHVYPMAHCVLTVSQELGRVLVRAGVPEGKIKCILNGVDTRKFGPAKADVRGPKRHALGIEESHVLFGYVGRISAEKGVDRLLQAFARVNRSYRHTRLAIVGDGPMLGTLKSLSESMGIGEAVSFLGSRDDVHELYPLFDVFVLPSLVEGLSNVVLEAMACGLAVVATDVGGNSELIAQGQNGIIVPSDSVERLAEVMEALVVDRERRERLAAAALGCAKWDLSLDRMIQDYARLYVGLAA
jgi:sugar transferase (PEP-CTERM/EpsH1 system associated)